MIVSSTITSQSCVPMLQAHLHGVLPVHQAAFTSLQQSGDVAAHEDDALWPNRVCYLLSSVSSIQCQNGTPLDGCDQAFTAI